MTQFYNVVRNAIPRLRRYGCLLTGSRAVADDYAQVCLERLILQKRDPAASITTVDIYRTFHRVVSDAEIRLDTTRPAPASRSDYQWLTLPVDQRTAVLLVHAEGFTRAEAAFVTDLPEDEFSRKLQLGRSNLMSRIAAPVFIIEDETLLAAGGVSALVQAFGHDVCGTARRSRDARAAIDAAHPALILADVGFDTMANGGIDICEDVCSLYDVPVIYLTDHADHVRGFVKRDNVFVIAKPLDREILRATIGMALA
jgi:hypothetical protein